MSEPLIYSSSVDYLSKESDYNLLIKYEFDEASIVSIPKQRNTVIKKISIVETNNATSIENKLNNKRLSELEQKFSKQLISHILEDDFEYGMDYKAHIIVKEQMKVNSTVTKDWLNRIFVNNFHNSEILIGILHIIARFEKEEIYPIGETIALASLSHKDEIVKENAIRAFENWGGLGSLKLLEKVSVSSEWVKKYLDEVISDLKTEYASSEN